MLLDLIKASKPDWDRLYEVAAAQDGYITARQAAEVGYSPQLLAKHVRAGRLTKPLWGIYRLHHFPIGEHEEFTLVWLWYHGAGVISHDTALSLHGLSDVLPSKVHITLPYSWRGRRLRVLDGVVLHYADVPESDRIWLGAFPLTTPRRTLDDCARASLAPDLLQQASRDAIRRKMVKRGELKAVREALKPFTELRA